MRNFVIVLALAAVLAACATQRPPGIPAQPPSPPPPPGQKPATCGILLEQADFTATVASDAEVKEVAGKAGQPVAMAPGRYAIGDFVFLSKDAGGVVWTVPRPGKAFEFNLAPGQTEVLACGPPFTLSVIATYTAGTVAFRPRITGRNGELYPPGAIRKGEEALPAPRVEIADAAGKILATGAFRYG